MSCPSAFCWVLSCGLCGSLHQDTSDDEVWRQQRETLLEKGPSASVAHHSNTASTSTARSQASRAKPPVKTSNILGLGIRDVNADYEFGHLLGEGAFGVVRRCHHRRTGEEFACKTVEKSQLRRRADVEDVRREVQILMMLSSHPNVAALLHCYEDEAAVHMILELCEGGQLFDEICAQGVISERIIARFFRKMVEVVQHCHTLGIAHRDIKPENFLLSKSGPTGEIKAADFGLSQFFRPGRSFKSLVGSAYFVAPEVLRRDYGAQADIWSLGVCLYILLTGLTPFWGDTEEEIFRMVLHADIDFDSAPWPSISKPGKDIVKKMLDRNPAKRPTAGQLLQLAWLCQAAPDKPLGDDVVQRIKSFAAMTKVKRAAMLMATQGIETAPQIKAMMDELQAVEVVEGAGVTADEASRAGVSIRVDLAEEIQNAPGKLLSAPELVAATLGTSAAPLDELVRGLFAQFDPSGKGSVSQEDLFGILQKYGINKDDVASVVAAADTDKDGKLSLSEFSALMARNTDSLQEAVRRRWHANESPQKSKKTMTTLEEAEEEGDADEEWTLN